jgi:hypothetical protein
MGVMGEIERIELFGAPPPEVDYEDDEIYIPERAA